MLSISLDATIKLFCLESFIGEWDQEHFLQVLIPALLSECCFTFVVQYTFYGACVDGLRKRDSREVSLTAQTADYSKAQSNVGLMSSHITEDVVSNMRAFISVGSAENMAS